MVLAAVLLLGVGASALFMGFVGYPWLRLRHFSEPKKHALAEGELESLPNISVLLPVHNGAEQLRMRVRNLLDTEYPARKLQILIGCDGCTDATVELAKVVATEVADAGAKVEVVDLPRAGKPATLNALAERATGEWIVIVDLGGRYERDTLSQLILAGHSSAEVTLVTGRWVDSAGDAATASFSAIEASRASIQERMRWVDAQNAGVVITPWGPCYAVRRATFGPIPKQFLLEDGYLGLRAVEQHQTAAVAWHATFRWQFALDQSTQLARRRRLAAGSYQLLWRFGALLLAVNLRSSRVLWGQKALLWLVPLWSLFLACGGGLLLLAAPKFALPMAMLCVSFAVIGSLISDSLSKRLLFGIQAAAAQLLGLWDAVRGIDRAIWKPTKR